MISSDVRMQLFARIVDGHARGRCIRCDVHASTVHGACRLALARAARAHIKAKAVLLVSASFPSGRQASGADRGGTCFTKQHSTTP